MFPIVILFSALASPALELEPIPFKTHLKDSLIRIQMCDSSTTLAPELIACMNVFKWGKGKRGFGYRYIFDDPHYRPRSLEVFLPAGSAPKPNDGWGVLT